MHSTLHSLIFVSNTPQHIKGLLCPCKNRAHPSALSLSPASTLPDLWPPDPSRDASPGSSSPGRIRAELGAEGAAGRAELLLPAPPGCPCSGRGGAAEAAPSTAAARGSAMGRGRTGRRRIHAAGHCAQAAAPAAGARGSGGARRLWPCARRRRGQGAGEDEELAGPLHAAPSSADAPGGRPPAAGEGEDGGGRRPSTRCPRPTRYPGELQGWRASWGEGAEEGRRGPAARWRPSGACLAERRAHLACLAARRSCRSTRRTVMPELRRPCHHAARACPDQGFKKR
ncbi:hypothetical protein PVAP13_4KG225605 [Panicum virgatum]|uniref:Uncharacterized protein n=1 Tax=Panicum virgatum TaxID=38727 RepID=A0A8T0TL42_PANVG|nr:hypothetical protein PVAP13_4KG225605 [Panicum virgatum]